MMMEIFDKPILNEVFADNGAHSHWELIHPMNGKILWTEGNETEQPIPSDIQKWIEGQADKYVRTVYPKLDSPYEGDSLDDFKSGATALYTLLSDKIREKDEEITRREELIKQLYVMYNREVMFPDQLEKHWQQFKNDNKL